MAYGGGMGYHLHMPSYFWRTFTEYPRLCANNKKPFGNTSKWLFVSLNRGNRLDSLFFDSCFLSGKSTQVIQFCATNTTHLVNRNIFDKRRFDRENSFYADVV